MEPGAFAPLHARDGTDGEARGRRTTLGRTAVAVVGSTLYVGDPFPVPGSMTEYRDARRGLRHRHPRGALAPADDRGGARAHAWRADGGGKVLAGGSFSSIGGSGARPARRGRPDHRRGDELEPGRGRHRARARRRGRRRSTRAVTSRTRRDGARTRLAAFNTGSADGPSTPARTASVRALAVDGGDGVRRRVVHDASAASARSGAAAVALDGTVTGWNPGVTGGAVNALAAPAARSTWAASSPRSAGRRTRGSPRWRPTAASSPGWAPQVTGDQVHALAAAATGSTWAARSPRSTAPRGGTSRRSTSARARSTPASTRALTEGIGVYALALAGDELYLGGSLYPTSCWDGDQAIFARHRASDGARVENLVNIDSTVRSLLSRRRRRCSSAARSQWIGWSGIEVRGFASFTFAPESRDRAVDQRRRQLDLRARACGATRRPRTRTSGWPTANVGRDRRDLRRRGRRGQITCRVTADQPRRVGDRDVGAGRARRRRPSTRSRPRSRGSVDLRRAADLHAGHVERRAVELHLRVVPRRRRDRGCRRADLPARSTSTRLTRSPAA